MSATPPTDRWKLARRRAKSAAAACALFVGAIAAGAVPACAMTAAAGEVVSLDGLSLAPETYFAGPLADAAPAPGPFGEELRGEFVSGGVGFVNSFNSRFQSWRGFAYSNTTDTTTPGLVNGSVVNESSAITGSGRGPGSDTYAVAYGYLDPPGTPNVQTPFDPLDATQLFELPTIDLPFGRTIDSVWVTNTTYAALVIENGNPFANAFGGPSGSDPDWFKLTAYGTDEAGVPLGVAVEIYLADYRFADSADDFIVREWTHWDLSPLAGARRLHFNPSSSDVGSFGMNTPAYFALDDLTLDVAVTVGDYNADGVVDAADYTVWRDAAGASVDRRGAGADGDLSGAIDAGDYAVWSDAYAPGPQASAVPEPTSHSLVAACAAAFFASVTHRGTLPKSCLS